MSFQVEIDKKIKDSSIYFVGDALPPDWYAAFKIWKDLADQGDMKAQLNVGWCYLYAEGVDGNRQLSKSWLEKAAAQNCPKANWYLSRDYFGTDDLSRKAYFEKAVALSDRQALQHSKELQKKAEDESKKLAQQKVADAYQVLLKDIVKAFDDESYATAKVLLEAAVAQGHIIFSDVRAAFDFTLENIAVTQRIQKGDLVSGGVVNGTTQTYQEWKKFLDVSYTVKNSGSYPATVSLRTLNAGAQGNGNAHQSFGTLAPGETKTVSLTIAPQQTCSLLPFTLIYAGGHHFKVPLAGYKKTVFPACESKLKNAGCFVVTACYGDESHPTVTIFRDFRDLRLAKYLLGRTLISLYYKHGPDAAAFVKDKPLVKKILRACFTILSRILQRDR